MKTIFQQDVLTISANIDLTAKVSQREIEVGLTEYNFDLRWDAAQADAPASKVRILWALPCVDVQYAWHPECRARRVLDSDWRLKHQSMLTGSAPLAVAFNGADESTCTVAASEVRKVTALHLGVHDEDNTLHADFTMGLAQFKGLPPCTQVKIRMDLRRVPFYQAVTDASRWWDEVLHMQPMPVPESCFKPLYSSWYNFHQAVKADAIERECALARKLGMETIILDDGWHSAHDGPGYGHTGDWEVCTAKIPDMTEHVRRVHALGMKYMVWYSVPFIGYHAKNFVRFENKLLRRVDRNGCGVLDPRYPDVREYLIGIYEHAVREYDLDGLKLDFIDQFEDRDHLPLHLEMDYACVQEATERLMTDVMKRVRSIKPEIMIEFRQRYIGPAMHRFGNMFRVGDCASDIVMNRVCSTDLRLIGGKTATHSDMLTWNHAELPEDAALQILNSIFSVVQFSQIIADMPEGHLRMTKFWMDFARENEKVLLHSDFIPMEPQFMYPVIKAQDEKNAIIGVYALNKVAHIDDSRTLVKLINATKQPRLYLHLDKSCKVQAIIWNTLGEVVREESCDWSAGVVCLDVPCSGLAELIFA